MASFFDDILTGVGILLFAAVSFIGWRMFSYWRSFLLHWKKYRRLESVTTENLRSVAVPFVKIQITTRGAAGSFEVIERGIDNVIALADEAPEFYGRFLSVEVVTESEAQGERLLKAFAHAPVEVDVLVIPSEYQTPAGTQMKARGLHYAVEQRRALWNRKPGRTFIVHYDEESVMVPGELRKLMGCLAETPSSILEGPIFYPLDYLQASPMCRSMEANRPIGCYECRHVMEAGTPLHLHGSNLVIEESLENEIGWDIGCLDGEPFIAEDYVFGMKAFTRYGGDIFGWHGCVMLEQPPFSVRSAFKQRYRWVFGVLQGLADLKRSSRFGALSATTRFALLWGTRYRIASFAMGCVVSVLSFAVLPAFLTKTVASIYLNQAAPLPGPASAWLSLVGMMWIGSVFVGAWHNLADSGLDGSTRKTEIARAVVAAPIAGLIESSAALWAVLAWARGTRRVSWVPTPKTLEADAAQTRKG
ncbi:hypothetical protein SA2016_2869 [Sinomonas atrocyanea]|uniref:Glycosyltransferase 2-like domain-containing protein n=1 Tax=Sinomonas atrocyanea TaxID=37927 RepID=A0A127A419_9MICC|nr:glycosyltransferase family 2 protein [Sinomonas atrocyanea]AMM33534.1 hypothetical protein SA2016_2869 [Sinomonas atrocyanea]GEB62974.1 hypothetical protein SAT01_04220 [Sinomonas atrocyanea]GGG61818.1 hypothetical protein GCM10007172_11150 [Sinomonas atrocyanea]